MKAGAIAVSLALHGLALAAVVRWQIFPGDAPAADGAGEAGTMEMLVSAAPPAAPESPVLDLPAFPPLLLLIPTTHEDALPVIAASVPIPARTDGWKKPAPGAARGGGSTGTGRAAGKGAAFSPPGYRRCPPPPYPAGARAARIEGTVILRVAVGEDGAVAGVAVTRSSGHAPLDEAAVRAVRGWLFAPARRGGRTVAATVEVPVRFALAAQG